MKRLRFPDPRYYLIAATAFVSIFCLIPVSLYAHAGEQWDFPWYLLLIPAAIGLFLFLASAIAIRLLAIRHARAAAIAAIALFCLACSPCSRTSIRRFKSARSTARESSATNLSIIRFSNLPFF